VRLELRHADVVTCIATSGSISAAAASMSIPQPSLTTQLRRIERTLGGALFVRSRTGVSPTPLGERLIPMMADLVRRSEAIVGAARAGTPVLRLGVPEWTPVGLRQAVDAALPGVEVQSTTVRAGSAVAAVVQGALTAALHVRTDPDGGSRAGPAAGTSAPVVGAEPVWLALPQEHPWVGQPVVVPEQLGSLRWVLRAADSSFGAVESWLLRRFGVVPSPVVHRAGGQREALEWVGAASVAALVGGSASAPGVAVVPLDSPAVLEIVLVHRDDGLADPLRGRLVEGLRDWFAGRARERPAYGQWLRTHLHEHPDLVGHLVEAPPARRSAQAVP
jgi:DNA-binding transcriptional LysR family regulator